MKTYEVRFPNETYEVPSGYANDANEAVEFFYESHPGEACIVYRSGKEVLYAVVDEDGLDHRSWRPSQLGPIETEWAPVWQSGHRGGEE